MRSFFALSACACLMSCAAVGPNYVPPQANLPETFAFAARSQLEAAAQERWWERFGDKELNAFMAEGLVSSLDIQIARERLTEARAAYRAQRPGASQVSGDVTLQADRFDGGGSREFAELDADYVFDLFGGFQRRREQALATVDATAADTQTTRLAFQAELFSAYIEARFFQRSQVITRRSIRNRSETLKLIEQRREVDEATLIDNRRAEGELALQRANLPAFQTGFEVNAVRLGTLLGKPTPEIAQRLKRSYQGIPLPRKTYGAGVPANLLRNRPDIRAAERRLASNMAAVGVSEADLYPSLSIGGTIRVSSDNSLQIGPALTIPLLNRPRLLANRDAAISRARQAELQWQSSVRDAIGEVEENLSRSKNGWTEISELRRAAASYNQLSELSRDAYGLGAATLFETLDAEDDLTETQTRLAQAYRSYALAQAQLAIATGRGAMVGAPADEASAETKTN